MVYSYTALSVSTAKNGTFSDGICQAAKLCVSVVNSQYVCKNVFWLCEVCVRVCVCVRVFC